MNRYDATPTAALDVTLDPGLLGDETMATLTDIIGISTDILDKAEGLFKYWDQHYQFECDALWANWYEAYQNEERFMDIIREASRINSNVSMWTLGSGGEFEASWEKMSDTTNFLLKFWSNGGGAQSSWGGAFNEDESIGGELFNLVVMQTTLMNLWFDLHTV